MQQSDFGMRLIPQLYSILDFQLISYFLSSHLLTLLPVAMNNTPSCTTIRKCIYPPSGLVLLSFCSTCVLRCCRQTVWSTIGADPQLGQRRFQQEETPSRLLFLFSYSWKNDKFLCNCSSHIKSTVSLASWVSI